MKEQFSLDKWLKDKSRKVVTRRGNPVRIICTDRKHGFIQGAQWADQHPKKGLWDAEKVIKWLRANVDNYAKYNVRTDECFVNDFEEDLTKAMEK